MNGAWEQWVGHTVGPCALRQYLGGSGHSAVFLTEYRDPEPRKAVIKLVPVSREKATVQLSWAESAARLSHPHLLELFHVGLCQLGQMSLLYFVMEYADEDLSQVIPQRALSVPEALDVLAPALAALNYLHGEGFVHGHLKPANMLAVENQVKISGDLLCRIGDPHEGSSTPSIYDAPGSEHEGLLPAGDVWSLAMTLLEVLTQRLEWPVTLPAPFDDIVKHCLQRNPRRRWTLDDISKRLNPPIAKPRMLKPTWPYYAVAALAVLAIAILAGSKLLSHRTPEPGVQAPAVATKIVQPAEEIVQPAKAVPAPVPVQRAAPVKSSEPGSLPAGVVHLVLPAVPGKASSTIHGKLKMNLELHVDPAGSVSDARLNPPVLSRYFGDLALQAARDWKFAPSRVDGLDVPSKWIVRFEFERTETKVYPERIDP